MRTFSKKKPSSQPHKQSSSHTHKAEGYRRGEDILVNAVITAAEATEGVIKTVNVQHNELCRRCSATGRLNGQVCSSCHGQKVLARLKKIDVRIPQGVKEGSRVRVATEGGRGSGGAGNGDLFLLIQISFEQALKVEGLTVSSDISISVIDAVLGTEVDVTTLNGSVKMTVPPLTSSGKVLRLKGQGAREGQQVGDHLVTINIQAPPSLSTQEKELFQQLAKLQQSKKTS